MAGLVIEIAGWVVDLGPEGGGAVVAQGTPEQVAQVKKSYTGNFLASDLGIPQAKAV
jgi:excinuclease ABC subunit A